jgi:hypothetical protein
MQPEDHEFTWQLLSTGSLLDLTTPQKLSGLTINA